MGLVVGWALLLVFVAGATVNILLAVVFYWVAFAQGVQRPAEGSLEPVVGVVRQGSAAEQAGMLPGDRILRLDETPIQTWKNVQENRFENRQPRQL